MGQLVSALAVVWTQPRHSRQEGKHRQSRDGRGEVRDTRLFEVSTPHTRTAAAASNRLRVNT